MAPEKTHKGIQPHQCEIQSFGKEQSAKEPVTVCTICYSHVQNMTVSVIQSSCYQIRSACCFPSMMLFSRMAHMLKFETPWVKNPSAGYTRCCLCSSPSPERWVNPWRKLFWTCIKLRGFDPTGHGNKKNTRPSEELWVVVLSLRREQGHWPMACIPEGLQMHGALSRGPHSVRCWENPAL